MTGKNKCKILKDIRREIAKQNDIDLVIEECKFKGECLGTCPRCESEVRYLEKELEKRRSLGKKVAVAGLAVTFAATASACTPIEELFTNNATTGVVAAIQESTNKTIELDGDIALPEDTEENTHETVFAELQSDVVQIWD